VLRTMADAKGEIDPRRKPKNATYKGDSPTWHLERPSTAERMAKQNAAGGYVAEQRTLHR